MYEWWGGRLQRIEVFVLGELFVARGFFYDASGRLSREEWDDSGDGVPETVLLYEYESHGWLSQRVRQRGEVDNVVHYEYDEAGRLSRKESDDVIAGIQTVLYTNNCPRRNEVSSRVADGAGLTKEGVDRRNRSHCAGGLSGPSMKPPRGPRRGKDASLPGSRYRSGAPARPRSAGSRTTCASHGPRRDGALGRRPLLTACAHETPSRPEYRRQSSSCRATCQWAAAPFSSILRGK